MRRVSRSCSRIVWKGALLTGTGDGRLLGLSLEDGRKLWSTQLEESIRGLGMDDDILLVGTIGGTVHAPACEQMSLAWWTRQRLTTGRHRWIM